MTTSVPLLAVARNAYAHVFALGDDSHVLPAPRFSERAGIVAIADADHVDAIAERGLGALAVGERVTGELGFDLLAFVSRVAADAECAVAVRAPEASRPSERCLTCHRLFGRCICWVNNWRSASAASQQHQESLPEHDDKVCPHRSIVCVNAGVVSTPAFSEVP